MLKAAFGRAGCGRLASLAVLAGHRDDDEAQELADSRRLR